MAILEPGADTSTNPYVVRSSEPDVEIPDLAYPAFVLGKAEQLGNKPAIVDGTTGRTLTYAELAEQVRRMAVGLANRGFGKGDVFGIYLPNLPEYAVAFLGVALAGGVNTTVNPLYTADELAKQLADCQARYLLTIPQFLEKALEARSKSHIEEVFVIGEAAGATPFSTLLADDGPAPDVAINPSEDLVVLPYSSGTTGLPKGVMLTHRNLVANVCQFTCMGHSQPDDNIIAVLPFYHIYGMVVIMGAGLYLGATLITLPRFELEPFLKVMQDYQVSMAYFVPPIVLAMAKHPLVDHYDLSRLRCIFSGAAPLGEDLEKAVEARLGCDVVQGYGLTETSPVTHTAPRDLRARKAGSVGIPVPNTEVKVADPVTGGPLPFGEQGEVCVRGPQVMKGYLNNSDATQAMIREGAWLHTGDLGYMEPDGSLFVVDRLKELIKYKGMQVAPAELEAVLLTHPAVADVAVIPSPDAEAGEVPKAFVVLKGQTTPEELMAHVASRVAPHKRVRMLDIVDAIPKSASGKILRRVLVDQERQRVQSEG